MPFFIPFLSVLFIFLSLSQILKAPEKKEEKPKKKLVILEGDFPEGFVIADN